MLRPVGEDPEYGRETRQVSHVRRPRFLFSLSSDPNMQDVRVSFQDRQTGQPELFGNDQNNIKHVKDARGSSFRRNGTYHFNVDFISPDFAG